MKSLVWLIAHSTTEQINATVSQRDLRTPLHLACAIGNLAIVQLLIWVSACGFAGFASTVESE